MVDVVAAYAGDAHRLGFGVPVEQVEEVRVFFQHDASGFPGLTPAGQEGAAKFLEDHHLDFPDQAGVGFFLCCLEEFGVAQFVADLQEGAAAFLRGEDGFAFGQVNAERLFTKNVFACVERGDGLFSVEPVGGGDERDFDVGVGEQVVIVGIGGGAADFFCRGVERVGVHVGDGYDVRFRSFLQGGDVSFGGDLAESDDAVTYGFHFVFL